MFRLPVRGHATALLVCVVIGGLSAWPAGASALTVIVGTLDLSVTPNNNFGCTTFASCAQTVSPTSLNLPETAVVPADGEISVWRVVGSASGQSHGIELWDLRPAGGGKYDFFSSGGTPATALDGSDNALAFALPVAAGDVLGVRTAAFSDGEVPASAEVAAVSASGTSFNVFNGFIGSGIVSPDSTGSEIKPLFNADVVLDLPVVSSVSPGSGPTAGGQTVTITGDHLANPEQVYIGGVPAASFTPDSNTDITAVTPPSAAGPVDVTVMTLAGTSVTSPADEYTFVAPPPPAATGPTGQRAAALKNCKEKHSKRARRRCRKKANLLPL